MAKVVSLNNNLDTWTYLVLVVLSTCINIHMLFTKTKRTMLP